MFYLKNVAKERYCNLVKSKTKHLSAFKSGELLKDILMADICEFEELLEMLDFQFDEINDKHFHLRKCLLENGKYKQLLYFIKKITGSNHMDALYNILMMSHDDVELLNILKTIVEGLDQDEWKKHQNVVFWSSFVTNIGRNFLMFLIENDYYNIQYKKWFLIYLFKVADYRRVDYLLNDKSLHGIIQEDLVFVDHARNVLCWYEYPSKIQSIEERKRKINEIVAVSKDQKSMDDGKKSKYMINIMPFYNIVDKQDAIRVIDVLCNLNIAKEFISKSMLHKAISRGRIVVVEFLYRKLCENGSYDVINDIDNNEIFLQNFDKFVPRSIRRILSEYEER